MHSAIIIAITAINAVSFVPVSRTSSRRHVDDHSESRSINHSERDSEANKRQVSKKLGGELNPASGSSRETARSETALDYFGYSDYVMLQRRNFLL